MDNGTLDNTPAVEIGRTLKPSSTNNKARDLAGLLGVEFGDLFDFKKNKKIVFPILLFNR
jgi:hypothetical protein